jgi:hypothetical protein
LRNRYNFLTCITASWPGSSNDSSLLSTGQKLRPLSESHLSISTCTHTRTHTHTHTYKHTYTHTHKGEKDEKTHEKSSQSRSCCRLSPVRRARYPSTCVSPNSLQISSSQKGITGLETRDLPVRLLAPDPRSIPHVGLPLFGSRGYLHSSYSIAGAATTLHLLGFRRVTCV